jgi:hypothetical protein
MEMDGRLINLLKKVICRKYICEAFSIESSELRNRLPLRARFLQDYVWKDI